MSEARTHTQTHLTLEICAGARYLIGSCLPDTISSQGEERRGERGGCEKQGQGREGGKLRGKELLQTDNGSSQVNSIDRSHPVFLLSEDVRLKGTYPHESTYPLYVLQNP